MGLYKRNYQEIVNNLLTDITGGIVQEKMIYTQGKELYPLDHTPVLENGIVSVQGTLHGDPYLFSNSDFELVNQEQLRWINTRPDPETEFFTTYYPQKSRSPLTDRNIGSVTRTLVESFSRELAVLYSKLDKVYEAGFVDTASDRSLELVVSLLGLKRIMGGRVQGKVAFSRNTPALGDITIPAGTIVATSLGQSYEVMEERTLQKGQLTVEASIRAAAADWKPDPAGSITIMPRPLAGIEKVTNHEPTTIGMRDETDEELRIRAKKALYGAGKATSEALKFAILEQGVGSVSIKDMPRGMAGEIDVIYDDDGDEKRKEKIRLAIDKTRAAGIRVNLNKTRQVNISLVLDLVYGAELLQAEETALKQKLRREIATYIHALQPGEKVLGNKILGIVMQDSGVKDTTYLLSAAGEEERGSRDILIAEQEKAVIRDQDITLNITFEAVVGSGPIELPEGEALVDLEILVNLELAESFIGSSGSVEEAQQRALQMTESKVKAFCSGLFGGDGLEYDLFLAALVTDKAAVNPGQTVIQSLHQQDGLVVILAAPGDVDWLRDGEKLNLKSIKVEFGA